MNLVDTAFIELLAVKTLVIQFETKAAVESLRIMLYRKLQAHIAQWDAIGYLSDDLLDATISVSIDKKKQVATLSIIKRKPRLQFTILSPSSEATDHETVSTDLEHNQSCEIQYSSADSDSQEHGAHVDSSCPKGESNGQRSTETDWESELRKFIESDSD